MKKSFEFIVVALFASACFAADFDIKDEAEWKKLLPDGAKVEKLAGDMGFVEGPVWVSKDGGYLVFSDIPNNELKKWNKAGGLTSFRKPSQNANGNTLDLQGRLVTAEHSGRRISVTEADGAVTPVVDSFEGGKFNSPNDVVVRSDGTFWFTDPDYGLGKNPKEQKGNFVYRYDPKDKAVSALVKDFDKPNGLCFSPDEKKLYVADSGKPRHIRVFSITSNTTGTDSGQVFCAIDKGGPDGIRCDNAGRIWSSAGDGVHIFAPDGKLVGKILTAEAPANLCFGGADGKTLYITARKSLYAIPTSVTAAKAR